MLFDSYIFIFLFLPIALIGYFGLNKIGKYTLAKYFLAGMSLWFYAYFNISNLWIILVSIFTNYLVHVTIYQIKFKENTLFKKVFSFAKRNNYCKYDAKRCLHREDRVHRGEVALVSVSSFLVK